MLAQHSAFIVGILFNLYAFHRFTENSLYSYGGVTMIADQL